MCTGTLLNNSASDRIPYFLTARHCISNQTAASSLVTTWFMRAAFCGSSKTNAGSQVSRGGATLLYEQANTDTAFMRLNTAPPQGVVYAGWSFSPDTLTSRLLMTAIHHPRGDLQKVSEGLIDGFSTCSEITTGFSCTAATVSSGKYLNMSWFSGVTESGSSGSGLFAQKNGQLYLVGQLAGGSSSCSAPSRKDFYGRFDVVYNAALHQWLSPNTVGTVQRTGIYRFYNTRKGTHFFTASAAERDYVISAHKDYEYEGLVFYAYGSPINSMEPVFRFYNVATDAHFYTPSVAEFNYIRSSLPQFLYEDVSWYAQATAGAGAEPVWRFYNTASGTHFYTYSAEEKDYVQRTLPSYVYEGVAYYAWSKP